VVAHREVAEIPNPIIAPNDVVPASSHVEIHFTDATIRPSAVADDILVSEVVI
jgi:glycyl-tRNA synthetase (class II)